MRRRDAVSSRVLLAVIVAIGIVVVLNAARQSERFGPRLSPTYRELTTVTTQVRLLESRDPVQPKHVLSTFVPPARLDCVASEDVDRGKLNRYSVVRSALQLRAASAGFHNKSGILDPRQWRPEFLKERNEEMSVWFAYPHKKRSDCASTRPPAHFPGCTVLINHHYKFIWIKGKRVGSTAIRESLGWICDDKWLVPESANWTFCSEQLHQNQEVPIEAVEQYWDKYFVFSFVRNPYAKFASAFGYVDSLMGQCPRLVNFGKLCGSPFLMAKMCSILSCCWSGAITHHLSHAMDQSSCLFTESGHIAVDFIGETENLKNDLQTVLGEINRRKSSDLPDLVIPDNELPKINAQGEHVVEDLFISNTSCLERVEGNYWVDFVRLGYDKVTDSL